MHLSMLAKCLELFLFPIAEACACTLSKQVIFHGKYFYMLVIVEKKY